MYLLALNLAFSSSFTGTVCCTYYGFILNKFYAERLKILNYYICMKTIFRELYIFHHLAKSCKLKLGRWEVSCLEVNKWEENISDKK
jgi:hypothetical protein